MKVDVKSMLIGFVFALCLLMVFGAATKDDGPVGRYQIEFAGGEKCFIIDTCTGRVWYRLNNAQGVPFGCPTDWNR